MTLNENVNLSKHTLFRFNILCVVRDTADPTEDEEIARKREDDLLPGQVGEDSLVIRLRPHSSRDSRRPCNSPLGDPPRHKLLALYIIIVSTLVHFPAVPTAAEIWFDLVLIEPFSNSETRNDMTLLS